MPRKYLWLGASLIVLGMTSGVLAFDWGYRHPGSIAGVIAGLNRSAPTGISLSCSCQANRNGSCAGQCKRLTTPAAVNAGATEETGESLPVETDKELTPKTAIIQLFHAQAADAAKALYNNLETTSQDLQIGANPQDNTLLVGITPDKYDEIMTKVTEFIKTFDVLQVQIEVDVLIVEVKPQHGKDALTLFGDGEKFSKMTNDKYMALLADLQNQSNVEVISAPKIVTSENQAARILVGQSFPYVIGAVISTGPINPPVRTNTGGYRDVGIQVQLTPKISPDGGVLMHVIPEITTAVPTKTELSPGVFATAFSVQTLEMTVLAKDGETAIIGGLTRTGDSGTTGHCHCERPTTELLVFVTPHVVK